MTPVRPRAAWLAICGWAAVASGGDASTVESAALSLTRGAATTALQVTVLRPRASQTGPGPSAGAAAALPTVVFSHGNYCDPARYGVVLERIAAAGFAVLVPEHLDRAPPPREARPGDGARTWPTRLADVREVIDRLDEIADRLPGPPVRFDATRLAVAGHSYGAAVAQAFGGAQMYGRDGSGRRTEASDRRVRAVVAWSPPGPMPDFVDDAAAGTIDRPMLVATGLLDSGPMWPDWRLHARAFETAAAGDKTLLVVDGMDHYLGGLACAARPTPPQAAQARVLADAIVDFLAAWLRGDRAAVARMRCESPAPWAGTSLRCR